MAASFVTVDTLKQRIEEAKAAKDFKLAQKLREELWTLRDTGARVPGATLTATTITTTTITTTEKEPTQPSVTSCESIKVSDSINESSVNAKSLQKLEKKMKAIQELKLKRSQGVKLEANQREKIGTEDQLQKEIDLLKKIISES